MRWDLGPGTREGGWVGLGNLGVQCYVMELLWTCGIAWAVENRNVGYAWNLGFCAKCHLTTTTKSHGNRSIKNRSQRTFKNLINFKEFDL